MQVVVPHLWVVFDLVGLAVLVYLLARALSVVRPVALIAAAAGVVGPLLTYLALVDRGWRSALHLDIAYASVVIVVAIRTKGDIAKVVPDNYLWSAESRRGSRRGLGLVDMVCVLGLYFFVELVTFGTVFT